MSNISRRPSRCTGCWRYGLFTVLFDYEYGLVYNVPMNISANIASTPLREAQNVNVPTVANAKSSDGAAPLADSVTLGSSEVGDDVAELVRRAGGEKAKVDDFIVLRGTDGDDAINISNAENGGLKVDVNGIVKTFTAEEAAKLIIDGGAGCDKIKADDEVTTRLLITGGKDFDSIETGAGDDIVVDNQGQNYIVTREGNDTIIAHGSDLKEPYGLSVVHGRVINGNVVNAGAGNDYVEGSNFNDAIFGFAGSDEIHGYGGDDVLLAGVGRDSVYGGDGSDYIEAQGEGASLYGGHDDDTIDSWGQAFVIADTHGKNDIKAEKGASFIIAASPESDVKTDSSTWLVRTSEPLGPEFD